MVRAEDRVYFEERERHARAIADRAVSRRIRMIHEELASRYRGWALAAEFADASNIVVDKDPGAARDQPRHVRSASL